MLSICYIFVRLNKHGQNNHFHHIYVCAFVCVSVCVCVCVCVCRGGESI